MKLSELQHAFVKSLHDEPNTALLKLITPNQRMDAKEKLAVYQNTAEFVLVRTLEQIYPICLRILGTEYFQQVAKAYARNYPSEYSDLNTYGEFLPDLFAELLLARDELKEFPYLSDLAKLEAAYHKSYYAADNRVFDFKTFERMTQNGEQNLKFQISESTLFMQSKYPILEIWEVNRKDSKDAKLVEGSDETLFFCIHRVNGKVQIEQIEENAYRLAQRIQQHSSLKDLATQCADLDTHLPHFIHRGWIDSFSLSK